VEICCSYGCAMNQHQCTATLLGKKQSPRSKAAVCNTSCQQGCVSTETPVEICCSYGCAMNQHQCTATLFLAKAVTTVLCCCMQNRLPAGMCQFKYTCGDLLLIQLCNRGRVHCNTSWQKAVTTVQSCCMQYKLPAGLCQHRDTCGDLLFIRLCDEPAPVHRNIVLGKSSHHCPVLVYAKQVHSMLSVPAITPVEICSSYRCAVTQHQCSVALLLAKCNPHCSVLFCKTGAQHA